MNFGYYVWLLCMNFEVIQKRQNRKETHQRLLCTDRYFIQRKVNRFIGPIR